MQYLKDDQVFEEAHNAMINRFIQFKGYNQADKVYFLSQTLLDFDHYFNSASQIKNKIEDAYFNKGKTHQANLRD